MTGTEGAPHWDVLAITAYAIGYLSCVVWTARWGYRKDLAWGGSKKSDGFLRTFNLLGACVLAAAWPLWWLPLGVANVVTGDIER